MKDWNTYITEEARKLGFGEVVEVVVDGTFQAYTIVDRDGTASVLPLFRTRSEVEAFLFGFEEGLTHR